MTTVDFGKNRQTVTGQQRVYLKRTWNASWELGINVHFLECTWCLSPSMPTAKLEYDYGWVHGLFDATAVYSTLKKLDILGCYVKIVLEMDVAAGTTKTWYGVVSHVEDEHRGIVQRGDTALATGTQTFHCYGLEKLLDSEYLSESFVDVGDAFPIGVQLPIIFNRDGRPNRNDRLQPPHNGYVFEGQTLNPTGTLRPTAQWWSTRYICDYLIRWAVPKDSFRTRNKRINWVLVNDVKYLPVKDHPVIPQEGQTVLSLLQRLIDRRRLRSFYATVDESVTPANMQIVVVAWNSIDIVPDVPECDVYLSNTDTIELLYDYNQSTSSILRKTDVTRFDRIVVRGARRTSTATFLVDDLVLDLGWANARETAYEAGASGDAGYGGWDRLKQMQRNAEVRTADELTAVYSWFALPDDWAQSILSPTGAGTYAAFVDEGGNLVPQDIHEVFFEPSVPLYEHVDYSGAIIGAGTAANPLVAVYRQPLLVFKVPTDARWVAGDGISTLAESTCDPEDGSDGRNWRWSAMCRVQPKSRTLEVRVAGEPQHVIAKTDFTPLAEDRDLGDFDYRSKKMLITATLLDNRSCEGKYPSDGTGDGTLVDQQVGFVIYAGDDYRQDYVVPDTVVDVDDAGALVQSAGGYVRDDTDLLVVLARIAYEWWNLERTILTFQTTQLTDAIHIGTYITTIGTHHATNWTHFDYVNSVISELKVTWPRLQGNQVDAPVMQFTTGVGELDAMTLAPPRSRTHTRREARAARR